MNKSETIKHISKMLVVSMLFLAADQVPVGIDLQTLANRKPGYYIAMRDKSTLRKVAVLTSGQRKTFSGTMYVLNHPRKGIDVPLIFSKGKRVITENPSKFRALVDNTVEKTIALYPANADIRFAFAGEDSFSLHIPRELSKLKGFSGNLIYTPKTMKRGDGLTVTIKGDKVTAVQ